MQTTTEIPRFLQLSITYFVPGEMPSQNARIKSALSMIVMFRLRAQSGHTAYTPEEIQSILFHIFLYIPLCRYPHPWHLPIRFRSHSRGDIIQDFLYVPLLILQQPLSYTNLSSFLVLPAQVKLFCTMSPEKICVHAKPVPPKILWNMTQKSQNRRLRTRETDIRFPCFL